jgi:SAM-dependent methyltransferase
MIKQCKKEGSMTKLQGIDDPKYVSKQYQNADNLNVRILLHQKFSTNPYGWQRWLFDQFQLTAPCKVLELGCGAGHLWLENLERIPPGLEITLSDYSEGMLAQARENLGEKAYPFRFEVIDAQDIPYETGSFDVLVANAMLYHIPDRAKAISEMRRVLKPDGILYTTTTSRENMKEIGELLARFEPKLAVWRKYVTEAFGLENGADQLGKSFGEVTLLRYPDSLRVTDAQMLADYILSGRIDLPVERYAELRQFVQQELQANGGQYHITKDSGLFIAKGVA